MEQTVERPLSQEQGISQIHMQYNGSNNSGVQFEKDSSERWFPRSTVWRGTIPTDNRFRQDNFPKPPCRDYLRGSCARGASCKYHHSESNGHDSSRFYQKEQENLVSVAGSGDSQLCRTTEENNLRTRFSSRGHRSRSPCRRFQIGRCYNGASCPYLHPELIRHDRPTYGSSLEQKQVGRAARDAGLGEGNSDCMLREFDEANKQSSFRTMPFPGEHRSRSPCRNFLRGKCIFGASCKRLHPVVRPGHSLGTQYQQGVAAPASHPGFDERNRDATLRTSQMHEEANFHNHSRNGDFTREPKSRSPCRYFLSGKCSRGASCAHFHPVNVHDRTRYDSWGAQQYQGVSSTSRTPNFSNGSISNSLRISQNHEDRMNSGVQSYQGIRLVHEQNNAGNRVVEDVASRDSSYDRQRSRSASNFSGKNLEREVCINFTKGRCNRGEQCRHLHGYHYFASSDWKKSIAAAAGASRNFSGGIQHGNTMMVQEHDDVKNHKMSFDENNHAVNSLVTSDVCFDKEISGRSVCDVKPQFNDQKGNVPAMGERGISGERISNFRSSAEQLEDVSLGSQPFKRQNCRSRSPFTSRSDFHCGELRRFDSQVSQVDSRRDRCYNVAQFHSLDRRSYKYERPMYHPNNPRHSKHESNLVNPSHRDDGSKLVAPRGGPTIEHGLTSSCGEDNVSLQRHVEVSSQCLQLDQCPDVNLGSNIVAASKKSKAGSARCVLHPSHQDQIDMELAKDSIAVDNLEVAAAIGREVSESDLTSSCGEDNVSPATADLISSRAERNAVLTIDRGQESNEKNAELMPTMKIYSRKKSKKKGRRPVSEETLKEEITNAFEQIPTSSVIETTSSNPNTLSSVSGVPVDLKTGALESQDMENVLLQDQPVKKKKNKKRKSKYSQSLSCEETLEVEATTASDREISSSLVEPSSGNSNVVSCVTGVSADVKTSASNNIDLENVLVHDHTVEKKVKKRKKKHPKAVSCEETTKEEEVLSSSLPESFSGDPNIKSASDIPVHQKSIAAEVEDLENAIRPLKKRKKKGTKSVSGGDNMKKEAIISASKKELPTNVLVETSLSNTLSTSSNPVDMKNDSQINDMENVLMDDDPVKNPDNGIMPNEAVVDVQSALTTTKDGALLVGNAHSHTLQSLPKAVVPNFRRKLLVLDVNGLLVDIVAHYSRQFKPDQTLAGKGVFKRPFCDDFLQFCFERFDVGIWSSRTRKNLNAAVNFLMKHTKERLLFCWDQSHCTVTGYQTIEGKEKPLFLKELQYLWDNKEGRFSRDKGCFDETNTVLLDDSPYKALRNPPYTAIFPYPYTYKNREDNALGPHGDLRLYLERLAEAENVQKFIQENPFGQKAITPSHKSWGFYAKIACTCGIKH